MKLLERKDTETAFLVGKKKSALIKAGKRKMNQSIHGPLSRLVLRVSFKVRNDK